MSVSKKCRKMFIIPEFVDILTLAGRDCDSSKSFGKYEDGCHQVAW